MDEYTCEQLTAVINDPATDPMTRTQAEALFDAKCGAGGSGPGGQSGGGGPKFPPQH